MENALIFEKKTRIRALFCAKIRKIRQKGAVFMRENGEKAFVFAFPVRELQK